jgi:hypothetical protein
MTLCQEATRMSIERDAAQLKLERRILDLQEAQLPMIEKMTAEIERSVTLIELWAVANEEKEFGGKQALEVVGSTLEFLKGKSKVEADVDEATSLSQLLSLPDSFDEERMALVRVKPELNKPAVIAMSKTEEGAAFLSRHAGLHVVVRRQFKWTPAREDMTPLTVRGGSTLVSVSGVSAVA